MHIWAYLHACVHEHCAFLILWSWSFQFCGMGTDGKLSSSQLWFCLHPPETWEQILLNHHALLSLTLCILSAKFSAQEGELKSVSQHMLSCQSQPRNTCQWTQLLWLVREKLNTHKTVGSLPILDYLSIFFYHIVCTFSWLLFNY